MSIIFVIKGREAIPVRAIPFVTGWTISPDMVASSLAHRDVIKKMREIAAYHLGGTDEPVPMLPKEWDGVIAELRTLSVTLKANEVIERASQPIWRRESIKLLPAGVFVWKDEFITAFSTVYADERMSMSDERLGDRQLNLTPWIPQALREAVVEGFFDCEMPAVHARGDHQNGDFQPLMVSLAGYWETPFDQLPDDVKPFALELKPVGWDSLSQQQRQSVATQLDWQHDPRCEPSLYWELACYQPELELQEGVAREQANHGAALALVDVRKRIDKILDTDRARVGCEIQRLRERQAEAEAKKLDVLGPVQEIDPTDLPTELDAANLAFRAVVNGYGDQSRKPRIRLVDYLKKHYPKFGVEAVDRIATVANPVKTPGGMKLVKE